MTFFEELKYRGVIKDISSPDLEDKLNNESLTFYLGTDPTADSLHIGHYASFVTAKRLLKHGHKPTQLVSDTSYLYPIELLLKIYNTSSGFIHTLSPVLNANESPGCNVFSSILLIS